MILQHPTPTRHSVFRHFLRNGCCNFIGMGHNPVSYIDLRQKAAGHNMGPRGSSINSSYSLPWGYFPHLFQGALTAIISADYH